MNVRVMYPLLEILEGTARTIPTAAGISQKIARTNYDTVFHDPEIIARRHAWEDYLATEKSAESSSQLRSAAGLEQRLRLMNSGGAVSAFGNKQDHRTEDGEWTQERAGLHRQIVDEVYARHAQVPAQRQAVMTGGLPGAEKSSLIRMHTEVGQHIRINPDLMKTEMIRRGMMPNIPVKDASPMELSPLIHKESSHLAVQLALRAYEDGKNVAWDIGMTDPDSTEQRLNELLDNGYRVTGLFADVAAPVSALRTAERYRSQMYEFFRGVGDGGRLVAVEFVNSLLLPGGRSRNRAVFEDLKGKFHDWLVYDNSGKAPKLVNQKTPARDSKDHAASGWGAMGAGAGRRSGVVGSGVVGSGVGGVVSGGMVGLPAEWVPVEAVAAELGLREAWVRFEGEGSEVNRQALLVAQGGYLDVVAAHVRLMARVPVQLRTPGWRQVWVNMLAAFAANTVGFTVPTVLAQLPRDPVVGTRVYSAGVAALGVVAPWVASRIRRELGGADERLRLSFGDSANVGTYKAILGDLALSMGNLLLYGAMHAGLSDAPGLTGVGSELVADMGARFAARGGRVGRAVVSGLFMSLAGPGLTAAGALHTLRRNGVRDAGRLPETAHNRTIPDGIYLLDVPAWSERTNWSNFVTEAVAAQIGVMVGALAMDVVMESTPGRAERHPVSSRRGMFCSVLVCCLWWVLWRGRSSRISLMIRLSMRTSLVSRVPM